MLLIFVLLVALLTDRQNCLSNQPDQHEIKQKFVTWQSKHKITFTNNYNERLQIFKQNDDLINYYNDKYPNLVLEHNSNSWLTAEELFGLNTDLINTNLVKTISVTDPNSFVKSIDWRNFNVVTPVANQHSCSSCWIFSTVGALESAYAIKYGGLAKLSVQQVLDCHKSNNNVSECSEGVAELTYHWIANNRGICLDDDYSYVSKKQHCNKMCTNVPNTNINKYVEVNPNEIDLSYSISTQPVAVTINIKHPIFQFYKSGIIDVECTHKPNHSVLVVGYAPSYYIVKNSWGKEFGLDGYMLIKRNSTSQYGSTCIAYRATYPLL